MEAQELTQIWKGQSTEITINTNKLMNDFKHNMEDRERIVRRRDRREIIAAGIGMLGFAYTFYAYPNTVSQIGSVLGFLALVYIIYNLWSNRKSKLFRGLFLSVKDQLTQQQTFMHNQHKLLDTVVYWMATPIFLANVLIVWGNSKSNGPIGLLEQLSDGWLAKLVVTVLLGALFGYIGWMNKKAAQENWKPLMKQVDELLANWEEDED